MRVGEKRRSTAAGGKCWSHSGAGEKCRLSSADGEKCRSKSTVVGENCWSNSAAGEKCRSHSATGKKCQSNNISWKWVVLWSLWLARLVRQPTLPVRVTSGLLSGTAAPDGSYAYYLAVPYATVHWGNRFQAPDPAPSWDGVYDAINENVRCTQRAGPLLVGQENCLVLNVYTPLNTPVDDHLPVMVFIHGGGFFQGSGSKFLYGPDYLVIKGVILVTLNYRLNIQGFLCLGIKEAPGNAGMKDQVAALKWVKENIRAFGGNPDDVTIFGESAGGASVSFHLLSPMSRGLFHKAIMQSGSALTAFGYQFRPVNMASLLAKTMGYNTEDPRELYDYFMEKGDEELIKTRVQRKKGNTVISELLYVPCTEKVIDGVEPFLTDVPYKMLERGDFNKVPTIVGTNSEEGYLFAAMEDDTSLANMEIQKSLPKDLRILTEDERKEVADKLHKLYLGDGEISRENLLKLSRFHGEVYFTTPALDETELLIEKNAQVYNYLFSYNGWRNVPKLTLGRTFLGAPGATHADELFYLFAQSFPWPFTKLEGQMIERMTTLWTNFAKYGDPTPAVSELLPVRWLPTNKSDARALVLDTNMSTAPLRYTASLEYLREVYVRYRRTSD